MTTDEITLDELRTEAAKMLYNLCAWSAKMSLEITKEEGDSAKQFRVILAILRMEAQVRVNCEVVDLLVKGNT